MNRIINFSKKRLEIGGDEFYSWKFRPILPVESI